MVFVLLTCWVLVLRDSSSSDAFCFSVSFTSASVKFLSDMFCTHTWMYFLWGEMKGRMSALCMSEFGNVHGKERYVNIKEVTFRFCMERISCKRGTFLWFHISFLFATQTGKYIEWRPTCYQQKAESVWFWRGCRRWGPAAWSKSTKDSQWTSVDRRQQDFTIKSLSLTIRPPPSLFPPHQLQLISHSESVCVFPHPLVDGGHGGVRMAVAAWSVADLSVGQPLVGGVVGPGRDDAQNLQLELQSVVRGGGGQADAGHLLRRLDGQSAFPHQLWRDEDRKEAVRTLELYSHESVCL